jgi:hypothetical protein
MCLDPDVVPPLAGFRPYAILGVFCVLFLNAHFFDFVTPGDHVPSFYNSV